MKRRTAGLMMAMVLAVTILAGCGGKVKFEPQTSSIFVKKDGTVVSADMEDFIGNNYSETELKTYVEDAVKEYNSEHGAAAEAYVDEDDEEASLPVKINSLAVEEGVATLLLEYEKCSDYLEFTGNSGTENGVSRLELSTVSETSLSGNFKNAKGEDVTLEGVAKKEKNSVVIVEGAVTVQVEGKVQYMSAGAALVDKHTVTAKAGEVTYIVFK
ncbi:MAG: hypothetical protein HFI64_13595 [Lachnospiraceae bacterium]|nr:hypothetical protein [Lachnospiraceae bacterium]